MPQATFAAGCFWHVEEAFRTLPGVLATAVGYTGGTTENPSYQDVCSHTTGHAEVVQIDFDPVKVRYEDLLQVFWSIHDPTTLNRQGPDVGDQYRSAIFYHDSEQKELAEQSKAELQKRTPRPIVTQIAPALTFYRAEDYHQQYMAKHGMSACHT